MTYLPNHYNMYDIIEKISNNYNIKWHHQYNIIW